MKTPQTAQSGSTISNYKKFVNSNNSHFTIVFDTSTSRRPSLERRRRLSLPASRLFIDNVIYVGLIAVLVFTTLAHGAVEPWSVTLFELSVTLLLLLWSIKAVLDRHLE